VLCSADALAQARSTTVNARWRICFEFVLETR